MSARAGILARIGGRLGLGRDIVYGLTRDSITPPPPPPGISYRLGDRDDLGRLGPEHDYAPEDKAYAQRRLAAGDLLALALDGEQVAGYFWLSPGHMELGMGSFADLPEGTAGVYKVFVIPARRGGRVFPGAFAFIKGLMADRGLERLLTLVRVDNPASRRAMERVGFRALGRVWVIRRSWSRYFSDPVRFLKALS